MTRTRSIRFGVAWTSEGSAYSDEEQQATRAAIAAQRASSIDDDEVSHAVKKILLNFLQFVSLAAGLPLHWPPAVAAMFDGMSTVAFGHIAHVEDRTSEK